MPDKFREMTKNNGLKNVEWGSEEFVKKAQTAEQFKEEQEAMQDYHNIILASLEGLRRSDSHGKDT